MKPATKEDRELEIKLLKRDIVHNMLQSARVLHLGVYEDSDGWPTGVDRTQVEDMSEHFVKNAHYAAKKLIIQLSSKIDCSEEIDEQHRTA